MSLSSGSQLGPYVILEPIGAGGMGEVYRARDPRLGRDVAIKIVSGPAGGEATRLHRFEQEARAVAALSHPNVLAIFDIGAGDVPFLVTELLEGGTLRALIDRGPLPPARTVEIALQIMSGLGAAHDRGIVHRDLKPDNVFITTAGLVKILDFGLAKGGSPFDDGDPSMTRPRTAAGTVLGTVGYMSPEQVRGLETDHRTDIFAAGAVLYEMLTGRGAYRRTSAADTIAAVLNDPPSALQFPADTPPALVHIVRRAVEKDPNARFVSAREVAAALESVSAVRVAAPGPVAPSGHASVAVLPFVNMSADPDNQYFSDGLAEELINALTRLAGLRVASRTSSFRFRGHDLDIREIGRELGVGAVLEGSVRRAGNRLRITAQLANAADGYHVWSERYDREMADVFDIQDEIVGAIVSALAPALVVDVSSALKRGTENLEAFELYLKGRHYSNQRSPAVMATAIRLFEHAIALDPGYALAYAGLADCYSILRVYGWTPPDQSKPRALDAVTQAISRDPELAEAHFSMALYTFHFEPHWRAARGAFERAIAASPRTAVFEAYYGLFLATEYDHAAAAARIARARELDPHSSIVRFLTAAASCIVGDFAAAEADALRALQLQPESLGPRWPQIVSLIATGRLDAALEVSERVIARARPPIYVGVMSLVYGKLGRLADARRLAQELDDREGRGEYIIPAARLSVALGLQDREGVRAALAACVDGGAAPFSVAAASRMLVDAYRDDPEIDRLLDRLNDDAKPDTAARAASRGGTSQAPARP